MWPTHSFRYNISVSVQLSVNYLNISKRSWTKIVGDRILTNESLSLNRSRELFLKRLTKLFFTVRSLNQFFLLHALMTNKWFIANIKPDRYAADVHPQFIGAGLDPWIIFHATEKIFLQANVANVVFFIGYRGRGTLRALLLPPLLAFSSTSLTSFCYLPSLPCSLIACIFVSFFVRVFLFFSSLSNCFRTFSSSILFRFSSFFASLSLIFFCFSPN